MILTKRAPEDTHNICLSEPLAPIFTFTRENAKPCILDKVFRHLHLQKKFPSYITPCKTCASQTIGPRPVKSNSLCATFTLTLRRVPILANQAVRSDGKLSSLKNHLDSNDSDQMSRDMTKPTKWLCVQRRIRSAWASTQSDQSSLCAQWRLWSDGRMLGAQSLFWFLSCCGSNVRLHKLTWLLYFCKKHFTAPRLR